MKTIKFRAWDTKKQMMTGDPLLFQPAGIKSEIEVIGNIYETPSLLKGDK